MSKSIGYPIHTMQNTFQGFSNWLKPDLVRRGSSVDAKEKENNEDHIFFINSGEVVYLSMESVEVDVRMRAPTKKKALLWSILTCQLLSSKSARVQTPLA
jgi:hypothetical protein